MPYFPYRKSPCTKWFGGQIQEDFHVQFAQYQADFSVLPPAPAFRLFSRSKVDRLVVRLQRRTLALTPRPEEASENLTVDEKAKSNPKYLGLRKVSREELHEINKRLGRPTKTAILRERPPRHLATLPEMAI